MTFQSVFLPASAPHRNLVAGIVVALLCLAALGSQAANAQTNAEQTGVKQTLVEKNGDWTIRGEQTIRDTHLRIDGNLILPEGSKLILQDCTIEILGDYSRHHSVEWKGGALVTERCEIGGFVNDAGVAIHTVFHLYEGRWDATDTTVSYSYGVSFHWKEGKGVLRGIRLVAGPRPDAIILSAEADVELVDSDFPIALGVYVDEGGKTNLNLQPSESVTAGYDASTLLPGVKWRLKLVRTRVERWFLFIRNIGDWQPEAEITLIESKDLIVSVMGHNLKGDVVLSNDLAEPLTLGNVTLRRGSSPAGISMYGLYFSGDETDLRMSGATHVCELMISGGRLHVQGTPSATTQTPPISLGCTTTELSGDAMLELDNVHLGRPLTWQPENSVGEANVKGDAQLRGTNVSIRNVRFRTESKGSVKIDNVRRHGTIEKQSGGGEIKLTFHQDNTEQPDVQIAAKPKVWIYTDMSDPALKGSERGGSVNDPDDVSAMAGYLLMANEFETLGIVVASTHRREHRTSPDQAAWANSFFGSAYQTDLPGLNQVIGGYPETIEFTESSIKQTAEHFNAKGRYRDLSRYESVAALIDAVDALPEGDLINVLCWGSMTEPAILVRHCIETKTEDRLRKLRFIAHWTNSTLHQGTPDHPERVANCREDATACAYLKDLAAQGTVIYYECGAIGQHGIVSGGPKGKVYFDQFRSSRLGEIFVEGKFAYNGVDHSDSATYWMLLINRDGTDWGVNLNDLSSDGTNWPETERKNEAAFKAASKRIHNELRRRSKAAQIDR